MLYKCMLDKGTGNRGSYDPNLVLRQTAGIFLPTPVTRCYVSYVKTTRIHSSTTVLFKIMHVSSFEALKEV